MVDTMELEEISLEEGNANPPRPGDNQAPSDPPRYAPYNEVTTTALKLNLIRRAFKGFTAFVSFGSLPVAATELAYFVYNSVNPDISKWSNPKPTSFEVLLCAERSPMQKAFRTTYFLIGLTILYSVIILIHGYISDKLPLWIYRKNMGKKTKEQRKAVYSEYEKLWKQQRGLSPFGSYVFAWSFTVMVAMITVVATGKHCEGLKSIYASLR